MNSYTNILVVALLAAALAGCGGDSPDGSQSPADRFKGSTGGEAPGGDGEAPGGGGDGDPVAQEELSLGSGIGDSFSPGKLTISDADLWPGEATTVSVDVVDADYNPVTEPVTINFSSDCVRDGSARFDATTVATVNGRASATYTTEACSPKDVIRVGLSANGSVEWATAEIVTHIVQAGGGSAEAFVPGVLAAADVELNAGESTTVTLNLVDGTYAPVPRPALAQFTSSCFEQGLAKFEQTDVQTVNGAASVTYTNLGCAPSDEISVSTSLYGSSLAASIELKTNTIKMGTGSGDSFVANQATTSHSNLPAGSSAVISVDLVNQDNQPVREPVAVQFSSSCEQRGQAMFEPSTADSWNGRASAVYTAAGCAGADTITVSADINGVPLQSTVEVAIDEDSVRYLEYVSATQNQIALAGMGGTETTSLSFKLVGTSGNPVPGQAVTFNVNSGDAQLRFIDSDTSTHSDNAGMVTATVQSGTVSTLARITATDDATGATAISEQIVVSTGVPMANRFSLSTETLNPPDAAYVDGIATTFSIIATDQFGHSPVDGTRILFVSPESGKIDPFCELEDGRCSVTWVSADPRPLDGRVSVMAYTIGAEDFTDTNGNQIFDAADSVWDDLAEPCVDADESGSCDVGAGEFFVDADGDGSRSGPDTLWNGPCLTSTVATAQCSSPDAVMVSSALTFVLPLNDVSIISRGNFPVDGGSVNLTGTRTLSGLVLADSRGNALPAGTTIAFSTDNGELVGETEWQVGNDVTEPTGPYEITLKPDEDPSLNGSLILTVTPSGKNSSGPFTKIWAVNEL